MWFLPSCVNAKAQREQREDQPPRSAARIRHADSTSTARPATPAASAARGGACAPCFSVMFVSRCHAFQAFIRKLPRVLLAGAACRCRRCRLLPVLAVAACRCTVACVGMHIRPDRPACREPACRQAASTPPQRRRQPFALRDIRKRLHLRARGNIRRRRILAQLQRPDVRHDRPAVCRRHLRRVVRHRAIAVRHHVEEVAQRSSLQPRACGSSPPARSRAAQSCPRHCPPASGTACSTRCTAPARAPAPASSPGRASIALLAVHQAGVEVRCPHAAVRAPPCSPPAAAPSGRPHKSSCPAAERTSAGPACPAGIRPAASAAAIAPTAASLFSFRIAVP